MALPNHNAYPEELPDLAGLNESAATSLSLETLLGLAEEHALNGGQYTDTDLPLVYYDEEIVLHDPDAQVMHVDGLPDMMPGHRMYVARYYQKDGREVAVGEKMMDIVIRWDAIGYAKASSYFDKFPEFTNFYFVNEGQDEDGLPRFRAEKHEFSCDNTDLLDVLKSNHVTTDPDYIHEAALGMNIIAESEAFNLARILVKVLTHQESLQTCSDRLKSLEPQE